MLLLSEPYYTSLLRRLARKLFLKPAAFNVSIHVTNCGSLVVLSSTLFTFIGIADSAVRHKWMRLYYLRLFLIVLLYL